MQSVTLPTCSIMRQTCNEVLHDALFYFTSFHGQNVLNIVAAILNKRFAEFMQQNPEFDGKLGGLICYDLLANQNVPESNVDSAKEEIHDSSTDAHSEENLQNPSGQEKQTQPEFPQQSTHFQIEYPKLDFIPDFLFALGAPIAATLIMRGQSIKDYTPVEPVKFFNIFNIYDPLAYRMEPLIDSRYVEISPVLWERPSNTNKAFQFSYYKEMVSAYIPDMGFSKQFNEFSNMSLPNSIIDFSMMSNFSIPKFQLPNIPILANAESSFRTQLNSIYESVPSIPIPDMTVPFNSIYSSVPRLPSFNSMWNIDNGAAADGKKRHRRDSEQEGDERPKKKAHIESDASISSSESLIEKTSPIINKDERKIKAAKSRNPKEPKLAPTSPPNHFLFVDQLSAALCGDWNWMRSQPIPAEKAEAHAKLTQELVDSARQHEADITNIGERKDFFLQTPTLDSQFHQYLIGLRAHFCYWANKDMMYHIIKLLNEDKVETK